MFNLSEKVEISFTNIEKILQSAHASVTELLNEDNVVEAIRQNKTDCLGFFVKHIDEVVDIVLKKHTELADKIKINACKILTTKLSLADISVLQKIVEKLFGFLREGCPLNEKVSEGGAKEIRILPRANGSKMQTNPTCCFSQILHYLIQNTNCGVLSKFEESKCLIPLLIKNIHHSSILNLLEFLTKTSRPHMDTFLANAGATGCFLSAAFSNKSLCGHLLKYVDNIIASFPDNMEHFETFLQDSNLEKMFNIALSDDINASKIAFDIIEKILDNVVFYSEEDRDSIPLYHLAVSTTINFVPQMVDFICNTDTYLMNKDACIPVLIQLKHTDFDVSDALLKVGIHIFNLMQKQEIHTILHQSFLNLIDKFFIYPKNRDKMVSLFNAISMKEHILKAYEPTVFHVNRIFYHNFASYVIKIEDEEKQGKVGSTSIHLKKEPDNIEKEWNGFISTVYAEDNKIMKSEYGGKLPEDCSPFDIFAADFDDCDVDCDDDDDYEESDYVIDENARDAAINIFGKAYLEDLDMVEEEEEEEEEDVKPPVNDEYPIPKKSSCQFLDDIVFEEEEEEEEEKNH